MRIIEAAVDWYDESMDNVAYFSIGLLRKSAILGAPKYLPTLWHLRYSRSLPQCLTALHFVGSGYSLIDIR